MKRTLTWRPLDRQALTDHLGKAEVMTSEAFGNACAYRCRGEDGETIAIALPCGTGLLITAGLERPAVLERRRSGDNAPLDE